jgi:hypothetical protein
MFDLCFKEALLKRWNFYFNFLKLFLSPIVKIKKKKLLSEMFSKGKNMLNVNLYKEKD